MDLVIDAFICRSDNYAVILHDAASGTTCSIDAPDGNAIGARLNERGWSLDMILTTHHHRDHVDGNLTLKRATGCKIIGPEREAASIPGLDQAVGEGDRIPFGAYHFEVMETPGHTAGHVSYFMRERQFLHAGDTLFSLGCGRLYGDSSDEMWGSLSKLAALPRETEVYCGHEYTEQNARFAATIEPNNIDLEARLAEVKGIRARGGMTLPTTIGAELSGNPFLRADRSRLKRAIGMPAASAAAVFRELRRRKDSFR